MTDLRPYLTTSIRALQRKVGFKSYSHFFCIIAGQERATDDVALRIHAATGIPKSLIRPDLWPPRKSRQSDQAA